MTKTDRAIKYSWLIAALFLSACGGASKTEDTPPARDPVTTSGRDAFVDIADIAPGVVMEMRYASANNFVGRPINGYGAARCLLTREAAAALAVVERDLADMGLTLKVYDCYRPQRAVDDFVSWAADETDVKMKAQYYPNLPKSELFPRGYIAEKSGHTRGSTADLTIDGLDMGSGFDLFDEKSHTAYEDLSQTMRANRLLLKLAMEKHGFQNYDQEWWHYTLRDEPYPGTYFDFPIEQD